MDFDSLIYNYHVRLARAVARLAFLCAAKAARVALYPTFCADQRLVFERRDEDEDGTTRRWPAANRDMEYLPAMRMRHRFLVCLAGHSRTYEEHPAHEIRPMSRSPSSVHRRALRSYCSDPVMSYFRLLLFVLHNCL